MTMRVALGGNVKPRNHQLSTAMLQCTIANAAAVAFALAA